MATFQSVYDVHQFDWLQEYKRLDKLIGEETLALENFASSFAEQELECQFDFDLNTFKHSLNHQLREIMKMGRTLPKLLKNSYDVNNSEDASAVASDFAKILVDFRGRVDAVDKEFQEEEAELTTSLVQEKVLIRDLLTNGQADCMEHLSDFNFLTSVGDPLYDKAEDEQDGWDMAALRQEVLDRLHELKENHTQQLDRLLSGYKNMETTVGSGILGAYGGWTREDHQRFVAVLKTYTSKWMSREVIIQKMQMEFPKVRL